MSPKPGEPDRLGTRRLDSARPGSGKPASGAPASGKPDPGRPGSGKPGKSIKPREGRVSSAKISPAARRRELLAGERGTVVKDPGGRLQVALLWPGSYRTAMSSLGYMWVHGCLSSRADALSERFFGSLSPTGPPFSGSESGFSLERGRKLDDFDLVAASLVLENDYWILPAMLQAGGIPPLRGDRGGNHPMVVAGGVGVWSNPWPVAPFVDVVLAGEGEGAWPILADALGSREFMELGRLDRLRLLRDRVPGALVPELWLDPGPGRDFGLGLDIGSAPGGRAGGGRPFQASSSAGDLKSFSADLVAAALASPASPAFLDWPPSEGLLPPVSPIVSREAEFMDSALVEISRGCPWGCRFCLAGYLYRPHRAWPAESILAALSPWLAPGARVGLVSSAVADHPDLDGILDELQARKVSVGVSSMRLSKVTEKLALKLSKAGLKGLAVAPEGGSERLRGIINKNLSEEEILSSARLLASAGLSRLKLYFMIGLPGETQDDLKALANLSERIYQATRIGKRGPQVTVSAANFTPKPHTPFEDAPLLTEAQMRSKGAALIDLMRREAKHVELRLDPPKWTLIQGLLARGGPESGRLVAALFRSNGAIAPALKEYGYRESHPLHLGHLGSKPWRVVAPRAGLAILASERTMSLSARLSDPCPRELGCGRCQACEAPPKGV